MVHSSGRPRLKQSENTLSSEGMRAVRDLITPSVVARNQRDALTQAGAGIAAFRLVG